MACIRSHGYLGKVVVLATKRVVMNQSRGSYAVVLQSRTFSTRSYLKVVETIILSSSVSRRIQVPSIHIHWKCDFVYCLIG